VSPRLIHTAYGGGVATVYRTPSAVGAEPFVSTPSARALRVASVIPSASVGELLGRVHPVEVRA
jgi:hypothetical protein